MRNKIPTQASTIWAGIIDGQYDYSTYGFAFTMIMAIIHVTMKGTNPNG